MDMADPNVRLERIKNHVAAVRRQKESLEDYARLRAFVPKKDRERFDGFFSYMAINIGANLYAAGMEDLTLYIAQAEQQRDISEHI